MRKNELTQAQKDYLKFDKRRLIILRIMIYSLIAVLICLVITFQIWDKSYVPALITVAVLVALAILYIFICKSLSKKHNELYSAAYGNDSKIVHSGLFGEIWAEFDAAPMGAFGTDGKIEFLETFNNTIDLQLIRKGHEFSICVDCDGVYMVCGNETDNPIEKEIPLSEFKDVEAFFSTLRDFVEANS